jgi:hypothetical protein
MIDRGRVRAIELAARFALIGEDPMVSVARAELFLDFLTSAGPELPAAHSKSSEASGRLIEGQQPSGFPEC